MRIKPIVSALGALALGGIMLTTAPSLAQDNAQDPAAPSAAPAGADQPEQEIAESHLKAARNAISAIGATDEFDNILLNAATQTKAEFIPNNPDRQTEISDMVDEKALELATRRGALEQEVARVYARLFTEQELTQIADFYSTEAGKKLLTEGPKAARESLGAANVWTNGILRDLRQASLEGMNEIYGSASPGADAPAGSGETTPAADASSAGAASSEGEAAQ